MGEIILMTVHRAGGIIRGPTHMKLKEEMGTVIATMTILSWIGLRHVIMGTSLVHHHETGGGRNDSGRTDLMNRVGTEKDLVEPGDN